MIHKNGKQSNERRKDPRFAVVNDLVEPIVLRFAPEKGDKKTINREIAKHLRARKVAKKILENLSS